MSIDEARRLPLHDAEAALVLMEMLPPTGWADVATRQDLAHLEAGLDQRIDQLGARLHHQIDAVRWELRADLADTQRRMIQWYVATLIAAVTVIITVVRLG